MNAPPDTRAMVTTWQSEGGPPSPDLLDAIYDELRNIAAAYLSKEAAAHTLRATDLVHEAWGRLGRQEATPEDRAQFIGLTATMMRRVLVDHARSRQREKRGGGVRPSPIDSCIPDPGGNTPVDLVALDDALQQLSRLSSVQAQLVDLRFFGGLSMIEIAALLCVSERTLHREWIMARSWLRRAMET